MTPREALERHSRAHATWYPISDQRVVVRALGELKMVVDTRDFSLTPHLVMDGFWESWITVWAQRAVSEADRVLNVGANCGYYALLFGQRAERVVAVEPQPNLCANLRLSVLLNGMAARVEVAECVAGAERATVRLAMHRDLMGSAFVGEPPADTTEWSRSRPIEQRPSHELMADATCAFIDAEGYEPHVWKGLAPLLQRQQLRWVAMEWSPSRYDDPEKFMAELSAYGVLYKVDHDGSERTCRGGPRQPAEMLLVRRR